MSEEIGIDLARMAEEEARAVEVGFQKYGLMENPFPSSAIASKARLFLGVPSKFRLEIFREIARRIVHTARTGRYRGMVVLGEFGLGKTYTLYYFSELINQQLGDKRDVKSLALYFKSPGISLCDFLSNFLQEFGIDRFLTVIYDTLKDEILNKLKLCVEDKTKVNTLEKRQYEIVDLDELREIINLSEQEELETLRKVTDYLLEKEVFTHRDFAFCISTLMLSSDPEHRRIAKKFILGDRLLVSEVKQLELTTNELSSADISRRVFPDILKILHEMGEKYNMIFVFVDEFEKIVMGIRGGKRFEFLEDLRGLIDCNLTQFSMILGCSPEAYETITSTSPAFADRNRDIIELPPIRSRKEIKSLIETYMKPKRTKNFSGKSIHPFSEDALILIMKEEKGSPRYILEACHKLLNYALSCNRSKITKKLVQKWYGIK
jgi:hypothetical protein